MGVNYTAVDGRDGLPWVLVLGAEHLHEVDFVDGVVVEDSITCDVNLVALDTVCAKAFALTGNHGTERIDLADGSCAGEMLVLKASRGSQVREAGAKAVPLGALLVPLHGS